MKKNSFTITLLTLLFLPLSLGAVHKVRIASATGYDLLNELSGGQYLSEEIKIAVAHPISDRNKPMNVELSVNTMYSTNFADTKLSSLAFGFGIRVFLNTLTVIRPYFTHEVLTRLLYLDGQSNMAKTYSILLGLGLDIPLDPEKDGSSIFFDVSYLFYESGYFGIPGDEVKTLGLTVGYSIGF